MSTGTFQFSFRQWDKEGGTTADIPVPPHQLLEGFPAQILLLRAVWCLWLRDEEVLGRSGGVQTLLPLWGEDVQWVWGASRILEGLPVVLELQVQPVGLQLGCSVPQHQPLLQGPSPQGKAEGVTGAGSPGCPTAHSPQSLQNSPFLTSQLLPRPWQVTLSPSTSQKQLPLPSNAPHPSRAWVPLAGAGPGGLGGRQGDMAQPWQHAGCGCFPWDKHNTGGTLLYRSSTELLVTRPVSPRSRSSSLVCRAGPGCAARAPRPPRETL